MFTEFLLKAEKIVAKHKAQYKGVYVMFGGGGGGGTTTSTTNTVSNPWSGQQPFLTQQYQAAQNLYNNPSDYPQLFPGATSGSEVAPLNNQEQSSINNLYSAGTYSPLLNSTANAQNYILNGGFLNQGNPYQQAELGSLAASVTPQIESQFTQGNSMNNPAAAYATAQGLGAAEAPLLAQNYNAGLDQFTKASALAPKRINRNCLVLAPHYRLDRLHRISSRMFLIAKLAHIIIINSFLTRCSTSISLRLLAIPVVLVCLVLHNLIIIIQLRILWGRLLALAR